MIKAPAVCSAKNPYGVFLAAKPDSEYGPVTAAAVQGARSGRSAIPARR